MRIIVPFLITVLLAALMTQARADSLTLPGVVSDSKTHAPIAGAIVSVVGGLAVHDEITDSGGSFILTLSSTVKPGQIVRLRVEMDGYETRDENVPVGGTLPRQISLIPKGRKRQPFPQSPPTFSEAHDKFNISAGSISTTLNDGQSMCLIHLGPGGVCTIKAYVEKGKFSVDATLFSNTPGDFAGAGSVTVEKNVLHKNIPEWDRCFDSTAMEVVDQNLVPMFQVIYTTPIDILIYGMFRGNGGWAAALTPAGMRALAPPNSSTAVPQDYHLKRIFKYPSRTSHCKEIESSTQ